MSLSVSLLMHKKLEEIKNKVPKDWYMDNIFSKDTYYRNFKKGIDEPLVLAIITNKGNWILGYVCQHKKKKYLMCEAFYDSLYDKHKRKKYINLISKTFKSKGKTVMIAPTQQIHLGDFESRKMYYLQLTCDKWNELHKFVLHWIKVFKRAEKNNEFWWFFKDY
jgi:hypothetical protein